MQPKQSLYFEDLSVGMEFRSNLSEPFTEEDVRKFEALTFDQVHTLERPGAPPRMLVQGNFVVSKSGGLLFRDPAHFTKTIRVQTKKYTDFENPVFVGDRIYVIEQVTALDGSDSKSVGEVVLDRRTFNQDDVLVVRSCPQVYRVRKRSLT